MESSRSGLFSTLLMTLPLIVVPAIALLRPPGHSPSISTAPLNATEDPDWELLEDFDLVESDSATERQNGRSNRPPDTSGNDFEELFSEPARQAKNYSSANQGAGSNDSTTLNRELSNPFEWVEAEDNAPPNQNQAPDTEGGADKIVEELNVNGAIRTMWFEAGPKTPVGFAAFFRGQTDLTRIRFEAVGQSREECALNVLNQVRKWQAR